MTAREMSCAPLPRCPVIRIQPTPEPTPTTKPKRGVFSAGETGIPAITAATALGENEEGLVDILSERFTLRTISYSPAE